jgi:biopolymer transport protein ExbD
VDLMSHAAVHGSASDAEPNLVPLLDLVLQLIMFFMMCAQFAVMEQTDRAIQLPLAQQAKPVPDTGPEVVFLGVTEHGEVKVVGRPRPLKTDDEITVFLKQDVYDSALRAARAKGESEVKTVVVIRGDKDANFEQIYRIMRRCQEAGLRKLQLRAIQAGGARG